MSEEESLPHNNEHYDDSAANIFLISVVGIILVIWSWNYYQKLKEAAHSSIDKEAQYCGCDGCSTKKKKRKETQNTWGFFDWIKLSIYCLLWLFLLFTVYKAATTSSKLENQVFDPYDILGLPYSASSSQIKKAARELKLKYHPDKNQGDEEANEKFILVGKAEKTLTDEGTREKWEKYGNPDGPGRMTLGMALPSWIVKPTNANTVLALYVFCLVVLFPMSVYYWQKSFSNEDIVVSRETMTLYAKNMTQLMRFKNLIALLSGSQEFYDNIPVRESDQSVLKVLRSLNPKDPHEGGESIKKNAKGAKQPAEPFPPFILKNNQLLFTQLSRLSDKLNPELAEDLKFFVSQAPILLTAMAEVILMQARFFVPTVEAINIIAMIVQGVWSEGAQLKRDTHFLQLPHISEKWAQALTASKSRSADKVKNLKEFAELTPEKRKELLSEELSESQIADVERVLKIIPADLKVTPKIAVDDEIEPDVTPKSFATVFVKISRPNHPTDPSAVVISKKSKDANPPTGPPIAVHAPHFPKEKKEIWWIFIGDETQNRIFNFTKCLSLTDGIELKIRFQAPEKVGTYKMTLWMVCDSYVGFDYKTQLKYDVVKESTVKKVSEDEKKKIVQEDDDDLLLSDDSVNSDDISDSDEE